MMVYIIYLFNRKKIISQNRIANEKSLRSADLEERLKTKFGPLCRFSFIKNLLDYRGLPAKMRFVGWSALLLNASYIRFKFILQSSPLYFRGKK